MWSWFLLALPIICEPIQLICTNPCQQLSPNETAEFVFTYLNPASSKPPFPFIKAWELTVFDYRNKTRKKTNSFEWVRDSSTTTIQFKPNEWLENVDMIGIEMKWTENNFDGTVAGVGSQILLYIDINRGNETTKPTGTSAPNGTSTLIIGPKASAVNHQLPLYWLLFLFVI
jgi:hypothetical protein